MSNNLQLATLMNKYQQTCEVQSNSAAEKFIFCYVCVFHQNKNVQVSDKYLNRSLCKKRQLKVII